MLDVCSKIVGTIMSVRPQTLLRVNGNPMYYGSVPRAGCAEATLSTKIILQWRREFDIDACAFLLI